MSSQKITYIIYLDTPLKKLYFFLNSTDWSLTSLQFTSYRRVLSLLIEDFMLINRIILLVFLICFTEIKANDELHTQTKQIQKCMSYNKYYYVELNFNLDLVDIDNGEFDYAFDLIHDNLEVLGTKNYDEFFTIIVTPFDGDDSEYLLILFDHLFESTPSLSAQCVVKL